MADSSNTNHANLGSSGQWELVALRFRRHKLAVLSAYLLGVLYLIAVFAEFVAPQAPDRVTPLSTNTMGLFASFKIFMAQSTAALSGPIREWTMVLGLCLKSKRCDRTF